MNSFVESRISEVCLIGAKEISAVDLFINQQGDHLSMIALFLLESDSAEQVLKSFIRA